MSEYLEDHFVRLKLTYVVRAGSDADAIRQVLDALDQPDLTPEHITEVTVET